MLKCLCDRQGRTQTAAGSKAPAAAAAVPLSQELFAFTLATAQKAAGSVSFAHSDTQSPISALKLRSQCPLHITASECACSVWARLVNTHGHGIVQGVVVDAGAQ